MSTGGERKPMEQKKAKNPSIDNVKMDEEYIGNIVKNNEYNKVIINYYHRLMNDKSLAVKEKKILHKTDRIRNCNKFWEMDKYEVQRIKDFISTSLCDDKFCNNCKKVKQARRMAKFIPLIRPFAENMYQLTLTVPNVKGEELRDTIKNNMFKAFARLIEYLKGKEKIRGIDFEQYGYKGTIRSLEVTYKGNDYHPHIHALIVFEPLVLSEKGKGKADFIEHFSVFKNKNTYSVDYTGKRETRLFSDFEILIQKIWRLLNEKQKVTKKNIEALDIGYSCQLDKFKESDFIELFKYMTKATSEKREVMSYNQFKTLYFALDGVRQIQGYGCFFNLKDDNEMSIEEIDNVYDSLVEELQKEEAPVRVYEEPSEATKEDYTVISRKKVAAYLRQLK